jgi:hypothetical protein
MTKTRTFTLIRVVFLALLATALSAGLLSAEDYKGTFTLPIEARWGSATLPPGDYSFTVNTAFANHLAKVTDQDGNWVAMIMASGTSERQFSGRNALFLVRRGRVGTVRALHLATRGTDSPKGGLVLYYSPPKSEPPLLAQAPELLQRIPVVASGK